jgi:DNA-binding GntR family transcriptional regulator
VSEDRLDDLKAERDDHASSVRLGGHRPKLSRSVAGPVTALLRERIISGDLRPGTKLTELGLGEELAVSRGPVRNALQALEAEGLVASQANGRVVVVGFDDADFEDLLDTRYVLEVAAAERAFARGADFAQLADTLRVMEGEVAPTSRLVDLDVEFHLGLLEASGSRFLMNAWLQSSPVIHASITITNEQMAKADAARGLALGLEKHRVILERLNAQDLEGVSQMLFEHFGFSESYFSAHRDPSR